MTVLWLQHMTTTTGKPQKKPRNPDWFGNDVDLCSLITTTTWQPVALWMWLQLQDKSANPKVREAAVIYSVAEADAAGCGWKRVSLMFFFFPKKSFNLEHPQMRTMSGILTYITGSFCSGLCVGFHTPAPWSIWDPLGSSTGLSWAVLTKGIPIVVALLGTMGSNTNIWLTSSNHLTSSNKI